MRRLIIIPIIFVMACSTQNKDIIVEYQNYLKAVESIFQSGEKALNKLMSASFGVKKYDFDNYVFNLKEASGPEDKIIILTKEIWMEMCNPRNELCKYCHEKLTKLLNNDGQSILQLQHVNYDVLFKKVDEIGRELSKSCIIKNGLEADYVEELCPLDYEKVCAAFGYRGGKPYVMGIEGNLTYHRVDINTEDDYKDWLRKTIGTSLSNSPDGKTSWQYNQHDTYMYKICKAYGQVIGDRFSSPMATRPYGEMSLQRKALETYFALKVLKAKPNQPLPMVTTLFDPKEYNLYCDTLSPKHLTDEAIEQARETEMGIAAKEIRVRCNATHKMLCSNVGHVNDRFYLALTDNRCKTKKYFIEEIERGMASSKAYTVAERSEIIDNYKFSLSVCKSAYDNGYQWKLAEPRCNK